MTDDKPLTPQEEDEALAAELVLGLLDEGEAQTAIARLATDADFATAVQGWQERLTGMTDAMPQVLVPTRNWQIIRERLGHATAPLTEDPAKPLPWWRGPRGWLAAIIAAAAVAIFVWIPGSLLQSAPEYQVELASGDNALQIVATLSGKEMEITLHQGTVADGREVEVWWISPDSPAPVSLGLVPHDGSSKITLPADLMPDQGIKIALSDEPAGGSPTGQPTGEIVAVENLTKL